MPFIGNQPALSYTSFAKQDFSTSATTSYTLDHKVANANELALFINFVRQEPTTAYSASGTSLTLTSATASSDDMYCVYLGKAVQTVNPPNASVGLSQLTATGTKNSTTFLRGDNTFAVAGGTNTPNFLAYRNASLNISSGTETTLVYDVEDYDTASNYDNSTGIFTPTTSGKYYVSATVSGYTTADWDQIKLSIWKNDTSTVLSQFRIVLDTYKGGNSFRVQTSCIAQMNGSSDNLRAKVYQNSGTNLVVNGTYLNSFTAFKIIE
jgi:hypothetical protein